MRARHFFSHLLFGAGVVGLPVVKRVHHAAPVAALATRGAARNKLLLRELVKHLRLNVVDALGSASGRERPAAAAAALVLHRGHRAISYPVYRIGHGNINGRSGAAEGGAEIAAGHTCLKLARRHVGKGVDAHRPAQVLRIVRRDGGNVGHVNGAAVLELLRGVGLSAARRPLFKGWLATLRGGN
jgi:hypothetical protein